MARSASSAISAGASAGYGLRRNPPDDRDHQERGVERDAALLRLAGTPFTTTLADGPTLRLLRVETEVVADVGAVTPPLGGGPFRYDPLPTRLVSRRLLRFVYFDWAGN